MMSVSERRQWAMFCHLAGFAHYVFPFGGIFGPLVMWQLRKDDDFVSDQGKEAINFHLSVLILELICIALSFVVIGIPLLIGLSIFKIIIMVVAAMKANDGVPFRYPLTFRFIS